MMEHALKVSASFLERLNGSVLFELPETESPLLETASAKNVDPNQEKKLQVMKFMKQKVHC